MLLAQRLLTIGLAIVTLHIIYSEYKENQNGK